MKSLEKISLEIIPLTKTEQNLLTGGFGSPQPGESEAAAVKNGNCSSSDAWFNSNCGCNACQPSEIS